MYKAYKIKISLWNIWYIKLKCFVVFSPVIHMDKGTTVSSPDSGGESCTVTTETASSAGSISGVGGLFNWVRDAVGNNGILTKVADKAKSSVDSMITTLDPQMKEFLCML